MFIAGSVNYICVNHTAKLCREGIFPVTIYTKEGIFANGKNMRTADILPFEYFAVYSTQYMHMTESSHKAFKELFFC